MQIDILTFGRQAARSAIAAAALLIAFFGTCAEASADVTYTYKSAEFADNECVGSGPPCTGDIAVSVTVPGNPESGEFAICNTNWTVGNPTEPTWCAHVASQLRALRIDSFGHEIGFDPSARIKIVNHQITEWQVGGIDKWPGCHRPRQCEYIEFPVIETYGHVDGRAGSGSDVEVQVLETNVTIDPRTGDVLEARKVFERYVKQSNVQGQWSGPVPAKR